MSQVDKQYKSTLVLVILFAVAVAGYFGYQKYGPKDEEKKDSDKKTENISLLTYKKDDISEFTVKSGNSNVVVVKNNGKFELKDNPKLDLDPVVVNNLIDTVSTLTATKTIGDNVSDLKAFGLNTPPNSVSIKVAGGAVKTFDIGNKVFERGYYIKFSGENKVYMIDKASGDNLRLELNTMRNKQLVTLKKEDITQVSVLKKDGVAFEAVQDNANGSKWSIKKPIEYKGDETKINGVIDGALGFKIKEFVQSDTKEVGTFGLDAPATTLVLGAKGGQTTKILIGKLKEDQGTYMMKEGTNEVVLSDSKDIPFTKFAVKDVADTNVASIVAGEVTGVEAIFGNDRIAASVDPGKDAADADDVVTVNNVKLTDKKSYTEFINAFASLNAQDLKPQEQIVEKPDLTITTTTKAGISKVTFTKKGEKEYFVFKNGKYFGQVVAKEDYDKVLQPLQQLKTAK